MISQDDFEHLTPGQKIQIVDRWSTKTNASTAMDRYLGRVVTVAELVRVENAYYVHIIRDDEDVMRNDYNWYFNIHCIDRVVGRDRDYEVVPEQALTDLFS